MTLPTSSAAVARRRHVRSRLGWGMVALLAVVALLAGLGASETGNILVALAASAVLWTVYALLVARHP